MSRTAATRGSTLPACGPTLLAVLLAFVHAAPTFAQDPLIYGMTLEGRLSVNGTVLDSLKSQFDADDNTPLEERFLDLAVVGSDRYALRADGQVSNNGKRLYSLPYVPGSNFEWISMAVTPADLHAIRSDGLLVAGDDAVALLPLEFKTEGNVTIAFLFRQIIAAGTDVYTLRADGAVFKNAQSEPIVIFDSDSSFIWGAIAVHPGTGEIYALNFNGELHKFDPEDPGDDDPPSGNLVEELPFPVAPVPGSFYFDLGFQANGTWVAMRTDGQIYTSTHVITPIVDYPGNATDSVNGDDFFVDLAIFGNTFYAVRRDGRVYKGPSEDEIIKLPKKPYASIALSDEAPDLSNFKNQKPVLAAYNLTVTEGESVSLPVIVTDGDKASEDIIVTLVEMPPGANYDDVTRVMTWAAATPQGSYKFSVEIDDGGGKPKVFKQKIKVKGPDTVLEKNKPPIPAKLKKPQALVGYEFSLPILATDPDGDDITITVDPTKYPFNAGATFDGATNTFTWTPTFDDIGKPKVEFLVSDGQKTKKLTLKMSVISPLIF